jgi:soluble P-type ATPase
VGDAATIANAERRTVIERLIIAELNWVVEVQEVVLGSGKLSKEMLLEELKIEGRKERIVIWAPMGKLFETLQTEWVSLTGQYPSPKF